MGSMKMKMYVMMSLVAIGASACGADPSSVQQTAAAVQNADSSTDVCLSKVLDDQLKCHQASTSSERPGRGEGPRSVATSAPPVPDKPWAEGVFPRVQSPWPAGQYVMNNYYQFDRDAVHVQVWAGMLGGGGVPKEGGKGERGVVVVLRMPYDKMFPDGSTVREYVAPDGVGSLSISRGSFPTVGLSDSSGRVLAFDIPGGRFSS